MAMGPFKLSVVFRPLTAMVLTSILFEFWLTRPVLEHLSPHQWRGVAFGVLALLGICWSLARWSISSLVVGSSLGLLMGGTWAGLPIAHGRIGDAFESNLELFGADIIAFTLAAAASAYSATRLKRTHE